MQILINCAPSSREDGHDMHFASNVPWRRVVQVILVIFCILTAASVRAALNQEEVGYVSYNGNPIHIGGSYQYTRADAEAMIRVRHESPGVTIEAEMWVTDLMAPNTGDVFQLCTRYDHPDNPRCPGGPWPGYGSSYNYNCTPNVNCVIVYNYSWRAQALGCPVNSTLTSAGCVCKPDFSEDPASNRCVETPPEPPRSCPAPSGMFTKHPIVPVAQAKIRAETDWTGQGPNALSFVRLYRSTWALNYVESTRQIGKVWTHNYSTSLRYRTTSLGNYASVITSEGYRRDFSKPNGSSAWSAVNSADRLSQGETGDWIYRREDDDATLVFNSRGKVLSETARNGWKKSYTYNASGYLSAVSNGFGQTLNLQYDSMGQLVNVITPDAAEIKYLYSNSTLHRVTYPQEVYRYFHYEHPRNGFLLTGITDETGARWATFGYDDSGRAIKSELAEGMDRCQISYLGANGSTATVTDPLGTTRTFNYSLNLGKLVVTGADKPDGLSQPDAASRVQSPLGLVTAETDFRGTTTTYAWDTNRRLPTSTTEATGTADGRTTVTEWHPQFRLPLTVTEPGRTTRYTYDGLGDRLAQTITDTGGGTTNGVARTTSWTYHPSGLVATETAPNGAITRFAYDALGNLASRANALGHTDTYTHDGAGRVLTHTAPTGLVTTYTYDARGRMLTMARAGLVTTLTYRPSGQVATAAMPHGHVITYTYDAAQRLTGWSDNRGASGTYVLDGMGNRLSEQVRNAQGQVVWKLARSINSLNRVASLQTGTAGAPVNYQYDANGDLISTTQTLEGSPLASGVTPGCPAPRQDTERRQQRHGSTHLQRTG